MLQAKSSSQIEGVQQCHETRPDPSEVSLVTKGAMLVEISRGAGKMWFRESEWQKVWTTSVSVPLRKRAGKAEQLQGM